HHLVYDIAIVRHEQQSSGILVQPPHIGHAHRIIQETHDTVPLPPLLCTDDPSWLIHRENDHLILFRDDLPAHFHRLSGCNAHSGLRAHSIHGHFSTFNEAVGLPPGADPRLTQILIQPYRLLLL